MSIHGAECRVQSAELVSCKFITYLQQSTCRVARVRQLLTILIIQVPSNKTKAGVVWSRIHTVVYREQQ